MGRFPAPHDQKDESKVSKTFSTVKQVEALSEPGRYRDETTPGLYVGVTIGKTGISKSYVWRGRVGGNREREIGLGSTTKVTLSDARKAAREMAVQRDKGVDPLDARKASRNAAGAKAKEAVKDMPTFEAYARKAIRDTTDNFRNVYGAKAYLRTFEKWVFPSIGTIPIDGITTRHIADVLKAAAAGGILDTAKRLRGRIGAIMDAAAADGYRNQNERNPADAGLVDKLAKVLKTRRTIQHFRAAPLDDIPGIYKTLAEAEGIAALALRFVMLAACRPGEALRGRWDEVNWNNRTWTIPPERQKRNTAFTIPLNDAMIALLHEAHELREGEGLCMFPGGRGDKPLSYNAFSTTLPKLGVHNCTPHSFRSSFRDFAGDYTAHERDVAEAALSHGLSATEASYRCQTALNKRRRLGIEWSAFLVHGIKPIDDNVVAFPTAAE
jgi:integrase